LEKSQNLCVQLNEGIRAEENLIRLEWLARNCNMEGLPTNLKFTGMTEMGETREIIYCGALKKVSESFFSKNIPLWV